MRKIRIFIILFLIMILSIYSNILYQRTSLIKIEELKKYEECKIYQFLLQTIITDYNEQHIVIYNMTELVDPDTTFFKMHIKHGSINKILFNLDKILSEKLDSFIMNGMTNEQLPTLLPETLNSFKAANEYSQEINLTCFNTTYEILTKKSRDYIYNLEDGSRIFNQKYPNGYLAFSKIGFNSTQEQALVFVSYGRFCQGWFLLLKNQGKWNVKCRQHICLEM